MTSFNHAALALGTVALLLVVTHLFMPADDHSNLDEKLNESYGKLVELHYNGQKEFKRYNDNVTQRLSVIEVALDKLSQEVVQTDRLRAEKEKLVEKLSAKAAEVELKENALKAMAAAHDKSVQDAADKIMQMNRQSDQALEEMAAKNDKLVQDAADSRALMQQHAAEIELKEKALDDMTSENDKLVKDAADNTRHLENLIHLESRQNQASEDEQSEDGDTATEVPLQQQRANPDSKQAQTAFPSQVKSEGQITNTSQHQTAEGTTAEENAAVAALEEETAMSYALSEEEDPSATMHGRRWSYAAALGNHGNEIRLPRAHELPRQAPNGTATWEAPRGSALGKYTVREIQEASGIDYSVPSSTLVVFHHVTHHAGTYWCGIAKAHYHSAVDQNACNRIATRRMPFKGYLIRKNRMPGDHNFPVKGSKWDKGGAEMASKAQMTQSDAINDSTLKTPLMIRGRDLRELGASWISYESYFPVDPHTKGGPAAAFDNLALDRRIGLVFVTRHPLTRLLSFDGGNKKLRAVECEKINREVLAAGGSDTFDCSQAGKQNDWPIGPRSNPTKECELVWRNQQWSAEKENYSLRWIGGSYTLAKTSRDRTINREYLKEAKRRVALGDVVITTHDTPKSICVMCKALRWNEQQCELHRKSASTRVSSHNSLEYSRDRFVGCIKKFRRKHEDAILQDLQTKTKDENLQTKLSKSEEALLRRIDGEYAWARLAKENALGIELHEWMTKLFETQATYYGCTDG